MKNIDPIRIFGQLCDLAKFPLLTPYVNLKIKIDKAKSALKLFLKIFLGSPHINLTYFYYCLKKYLKIDF